MKKERIDKLIASQGLLSRNDVKTMVKRGEVSVNGVVIKDSSVKVSYEDDIVVNGKNLADDLQVQSDLVDQNITNISNLA